MQKLWGVVAGLGLLWASSAVAVPKSDVAVVLIDMQYGFYQRGGVTQSKGLADLVSQQEKLLNWAVSNDVPVLIFEYSGFAATDTRLTSILSGFRTHTVIKTNDNGFYYDSRDEAVKTLDAWGARTLIAAGINGAYCVRSTVLGAMANGYDVITTPTIVGNINQNPPIYPNTTWYSRKNKFQVYSDLEAVLATVEL